MIWVKQADFYQEPCKVNVFIYYMSHSYVYYVNFGILWG
jgi:hypothetical protein